MGQASASALRLLPGMPNNPGRAVLACRFWRPRIVVGVKLCMRRESKSTPDQEENPMSKMIFVSLPIRDLTVSIGFYKALGFTQNAQFSDDTSACMVWSEAIYVMLLTHAKWRTFTQRPFPAAGTAGLMLSLAMDGRDDVDAMNNAAAASGGQADVNPPEDHGFMYTRDLADPDGHMWGIFWMDPAAVPPAEQR